MQTSFFNRYGYECLLFLLIAVFVVLKIQTIATPYFWDELGVYAPGALKMLDEGTIGLLPANLEPEYSRGHPLLFVFLQACWMRIFGDSVVAGHSFSILLACLTLVCSYFVAKDLFHRRTAFWATALLAAQPIFFAMAGVILPEMLLTLLMTLSLWAVIRGRWLLYSLFGAAAMMTKEAAVILPVVALAVLAIEGFAERSFRHRFFWWRVLAALSPLFVYALFLWVQKLQNGWYFFPLHVNLMRTSGIFSTFVHISKDVFFRQGRWVLSVFILVGLLRFLRGFPRSLVTRRAYLAIGVFLVVALCFSTLNFYLVRYLLIVIPFVPMVAVQGMSVLFGRYFRHKGQSLAVGLLCFFALVFSASKMDPKKFNDTADMAYLHVVGLVQEAVSWVEEQPWSKQRIEANFPIFQSIRDPRNGYLSGGPIAYSENFEERTNYGVLFKLEHEPIPIWDNRPYEVVREFQGLFSSVFVVRFLWETPVSSADDAHKP